MLEFKPELLLEEVKTIADLKNKAEDFLFEKVVLGIDIYKYSQYPKYEQIFIPVIFEKIYLVTARNCCDREQFIFEDYAKTKAEFKNNFISTGDGGFQIFDNPIQAMLFALYFQANVKRFCSGGNTGKIAKKLYKVVDNIELRYAITTDFIYKYKNNFYGPAIINNARILSKDSLNRLLIDGNTIQWLGKNINGVETLISMEKSDFLKVNYFKKSDDGLPSYFFNSKGKFKSVDVLKVGMIKAKQNEIDVYNLHVQAEIKLAVAHHKFDVYVISLGNLNTTGIE